MKEINESEYIFADMSVNENSIKALVNNFGNKLILDMDGYDNTMKLESILAAY